MHLFSITCINIIPDKGDTIPTFLPIPERDRTRREMHVIIQCLGACEHDILVVHHACHERSKSICKGKHRATELARAHLEHFPGHGKKVVWGRPINRYS